ncbi:MAG TPA: cobalamin-dependent protein [Paludibacteraceae bacterium]|nr:cobalamin-dependent protein [Paludibacteraceae bacterium]
MTIVLESHGFQVIDLGKNVAIEKVVEAFGTHQPDAIGLSALMTTTVDAMAKTIAELRKLPNICPIFVGGAVVTEQIAKEIGADLYGADALATVNKLEELWKK